MSAPPLRLEDASFGYGDRRIVSGVTLAVEEGDVLAVLGPNASGKSTIVRGVLGLADHLGGSVEILGTPLNRLKDRADIGYVPQHHSLSTSVAATVREVVANGRLPRRRWWQRSTGEDRRIVDEAIETVGLSDRADEEVSRLSGGQQRRVLIARALAAQPRILIMDEPTAGVDYANQLVLSGVLGRLAHSGTTMVIVTHELDALHDVVSRVVCVSDGRVDFAGTSAEYDAHLDAHPSGTGDHHHDEPLGRSRSALASDPLDQAATGSRP